MSNEYLNKMILEYIEKFARDKECLIARFLLETGLNAADICLVEKETPTGRVFYPDLKSNHLGEK